MSQKLPELKSLETDAVMQLLEMAEGDIEFLQDVFETYLQSVRDLHGVMDQALRRGDLPTLHRSAHQLKGASGYLGATHLRDLFDRLQHIEDDEIDRGMAMIDDIAHRIDQVALDAMRLCNPQEDGDPDESGSSEQIHFDI